MMQSAADAALLTLFRSLLPMLARITYMCKTQLIGSELCGESLVALDVTGSKGRWIPLHDKHNSRVGELLLRMAYTGPRVTGASPMRATSVSTSSTAVYTPAAPPASARRSSGSGSGSGSSAGRPSPRRHRLVVPAAAVTVGRASPVRNSPGTVRIGSISPPELVRRSSGAARGSVDTARMNSSSHSSSSNSSSGSPSGNSSSRQRGSVVRPAASPQQQQHQQQQQRSSGVRGDSKGKSSSNDSGDAAGTGAAQQPRQRRLLSFLHLVSTSCKCVSRIRLTT
jgi:hypothetical protein